MKANATFHSKMKNHNRSLPAFLAAPLLIAILALSAVALASYAAPAQAQSEVTLVTNLASIDSASAPSVGDRNASSIHLQAQKFADGSK